MRSLPILWQRLVSDDRTCDRCAATHGELQRALAVLEQSLPPLGLEPHLVITEIEEVSFKANPVESNRITIAGRPIEEWLRGSVGTSRCCSVCGDAECRTVEVDGTTFEAIPERLILKASLIAASELLDDVAPTPGSTPSPVVMAPTTRRPTRP